MLCKIRNKLSETRKETENLSDLFLVYRYSHVLYSGHLAWISAAKSRANNLSYEQNFASSKITLFKIKRESRFAYLLQVSFDVIKMIMPCTKID